MKRIVLTLIVLLAATSLFAGGGKECKVKSDAKNVTLTGSLTTDDGGKTVFRVANKDASYTVCDETKAEFKKLSGNVQVKGKVVNCSGSEELVITEAKKI
jgi:ABC-type glycerol-3-phosphate transport system substrate-binding protein